MSSGTRTPLPVALANNLRRWRELYPRALGAWHTAQKWKARRERLDFDNRVDPEGAALRTARLAADAPAGSVDTLEEYTSLLEAIRKQAPRVAAMAEQAGIDAGPLLLFAEEPTPDRCEAARAVAARASVRGARVGAGSRRPRPPGKQAADRDPADTGPRPNERTEQPVLDYLFQNRCVGIDALRAIPRKERPTAERLADRAIGVPCNAQFKQTLAHMVDLRWLGNGKEHGLGGGYFLTAKGKRLVSRKQLRARR
jgi:hypothetical protein